VIQKLRSKCDLTRAAEPELGILLGTGAGTQIKNQKKPELSFKLDCS